MPLYYILSKLYKFYLKHQCSHIASFLYEIFCKNAFFEIVLLIYLTVSLESNERMEVFSIFTVIVGVVLLIIFEHLSRDTGTKYGCAASFLLLLIF